MAPTVDNAVDNIPPPIISSGTVAKTLDGDAGIAKTNVAVAAQGATDGAAAAKAADRKSHANRPSWDST